MKLTAIVLFAAVLYAAEVVPQKKVYITPHNGVETYISAALQRKHVPVLEVTEPDKADYIMEVTAESQKAGWAKIIITRDVRSSEEISIRLIDAKTKTVAFAYAYHMSSSYFGKQSAAESCAKHLGQWMKDSTKGK